MRIGFLAPPWIPVPPPAYGGIERAARFSSSALMDSYAKLLTPIHGLRVLTPAAPPVFRTPTPSIRPRLAHQDLPWISPAFTAARRAVG